MNQQKPVRRIKSIHIKGSLSSRQEKSDSLPKLLEQKNSRYSGHVSPSPSPKTKYYNQWYIPYDKRFLEQKDHKNLGEELRKNYQQFKDDPLLIYHNLSKPISIERDPFTKIPKEILKKQQQYDKSKIILEMSKSSNVLKMFLDDLIQKKQRVPAFLMNDQLIL